MIDVISQKREREREREREIENTTSSVFLQMVHGQGFLVSLLYVEHWSCNFASVRDCVHMMCPVYIEHSVRLKDERIQHRNKVLKYT
jgi:hypothetical protein